MMKTLGIVLLAACLGSCEKFNSDYGRVAAHISFSSTNLVGVKTVLMPTRDSSAADASGMANYYAPPGNYTLRVFGVPVAGRTTPFIDRRVQVESERTTNLEISDSLIAGDILRGDSIQLSIFASATEGNPNNPISFDVQVVNCGTTFWLTQTDCEQAVPGVSVTIYTLQPDSTAAPSKPFPYYTAPFWALACEPVNAAIPPGMTASGVVQYFGDLYVPPYWFIIYSTSGDYWAVATLNATAPDLWHPITLRSRPIHFYWTSPQPPPSVAHRSK